MGKRFGKSTDVGLGRGSNLILTTTETTNNITAIGGEKKTSRTILISEKLYERLAEHSRHYYNHETYETIIKDLLDSFDKHNQDKRWYNNDKYNDNT